MRLTNRIKQVGANGYILLLASRNSDSDFDSHLSAAGLHIRD
jgi:hypothetical protein